MKDYGAMSGFEINCAVANVVGSFQFDENNGHPFKTISDLVNEDRVHCFNPCNSWADAGPIIESNLITITPLTSGKSWQAFCWAGEIEFRDKNPLRAAMIVFLMMQESK